MSLFVLCASDSTASLIVDQCICSVWFGILSSLLNHKPAGTTALATPLGPREAQLIGGERPTMRPTSAVDTSRPHPLRPPMRENSPAFAVDEDAPGTIWQIPPEADPVRAY